LPRQCAVEYREAALPPLRGFGVLALFPRLTPWASFFRCFAAEKRSSVPRRFNSTVPSVTAPRMALQIPTQSLRSFTSASDTVPNELRVYPTERGIARERPAPRGGPPSASTVCFYTAAVFSRRAGMHRLVCFRRAMQRVKRPPFFICLDTYMLLGVYQASGICLRNHCGAEPPRDIEPAGLVATVGGRDRTSTSYVAADRFEAPASAARGRFRGVHRGRAAPPVPAETGTISGGGCLASSVPPVLVRSHRCSRTPPRPNESVNTTEKEDT